MFISFSRDCRVTQPSKAALNETTQKNLWTKSEELCLHFIVGSIEIAAQKTLEENLSEIQETPVIPEKISDSSSDSDEPEIIEEVIKEEQNAKVIQVNIIMLVGVNMELSCNSSSVDFLHSFMSGLPQPAC